MVSIENVSFEYEHMEGTLKNINLEIKKGECILLCGESGCGKTTVTKLINGLIPHFITNDSLKGNVDIDGIRVKEIEMYELSSHVGSVFQNPKSQFFNCDTESELAFGLENAGMNTDYINQRVEQTVSDLHLDQYRGKNIFALSGGQKQTLAFGSVYAMNPDIYVLDEPTANLDYHAVVRLQQLIQKMKMDGKTIIIAEHRLWFLIDFVDRVFYIKNGAVFKEFSGAQFTELDEETRKKMGLRTLHYQPADLPCVEKRTAIAAKQNQIGFLRASDLTFHYPHQRAILHKLSFIANRGEITAITGENGVGKTTLLRCICGLLKEQNGVIELDGEVLKKKKRHDVCYMVMQDVNHQLFYDSVWNECEQAAGARTEAIKEILDEFDLLPVKDKHPMALSGGQKQRLAIATALLSKKQVLIFDEPTSGLDYKHMVEVSHVLKRLAQKGKIIVLVTHDDELLQCTADRVLTL